MKVETYGSPTGKEMEDEVEIYPNTRFFTSDKKRRSSHKNTSFKATTPKINLDVEIRTTHMDEKKKREVLKSKGFLKFFDKASKILEKSINSDAFFILEEITEEDNLDADLDNVP